MMGLSEDMEDLAKTGLFSRELALGKEAENALLEIEGRHKELKERKQTDERNRKKIFLKCFYCGLKGEKKEFEYTHTCERPMVIDIKKYPMPSRPAKFEFFEVKINVRNSPKPQIYRFKDFKSALLFRRRLWRDEVPLQIVLMDDNIRWYR